MLRKLRKIISWTAFELAGLAFLQDQDAFQFFSICLTTKLLYDLLPASADGPPTVGRG